MARQQFFWGLGPSEVEQRRSWWPLVGVVVAMLVIVTLLFGSEWLWAASSGGPK